MQNKFNRQWLLMVLIIIMAGMLSCGLFGEEEPTAEIAATVTAIMPTETPVPTPTVSVQPQKPKVLESVPAIGSPLALNGALTVYFNQPMDKTSVEAGMSLNTADLVILDWPDDSTVRIASLNNLEPDSEINLLLAGTIQAANGLALDEDQIMSYTTVDELVVVDTLPLDQTEGVDPGSAILVSFNRPVVAMGEEQDTAPAPFTISPEADGTGRWVNTSTYIFYPDPILEGGTSYRIQINSGLTAVDLAPLNEVPSWGFITSLPRVLDVSPVYADYLPLDPELTVRFNHPMDPTSVEENFLFGSSEMNYEGSFEWNEENTEVVFVPLELLPRGTIFTLTLRQNMTNAAGTPLSSDYTRQYVSLPDFAILGTNPASGQLKGQYDSIQVFISSLIGDADIEDHILIEPEMELYTYSSYDEQKFYINGTFEYSTYYTVTIQGTLQDQYGQELGTDYVFDFYTGPAEPDLNLNIWYGNGVLFTAPQDPVIGIQTLNVNHVDVDVQALAFSEFNYLFNLAVYDEKSTYQGEQIAFWREYIENEQTQYQITEIPLMPQDEELPTGIYLYDISSQEASQAGDYRDLPFFIISSNVHLTYKVGATELMVWAVDMRTNQPVGGESVVIYDQNQNVIAQGLTDVDGVFYTQIEELENPYDRSIVVMGEPGDDLFSLAPSIWNNDLSGWDFGLMTTRDGTRPMTYFYTDRPIYRPGQVVYFKGISRELFDGQYSLIDLETLPVRISQQYGDVIEEMELSINEFGTVEGSFEIPEDLEPGTYSIYSSLESDYGSVYFQVANYRKPEFEVGVNWAAEDLLTVSDVTADVGANYYFGAPTSDTGFGWVLYRSILNFYLPGYHVGPSGSGGYNYLYTSETSPLGYWLQEGTGTTGSDGIAPVELSLETDTRPSMFTLEATVTDESGYPVSGRGEIVVHPGEYYIGARSEEWIGEIDQPLGFEILTVDWEREPTADKALYAEFSRVKFVKTTPDRWGFYVYEKELTFEASTNFVTDADGKARIEFVPSSAGTYQLALSDSSGDIVTELLVWVTGSGSSFWSFDEENQVELQANQDGYEPGDTAEVFIPNPFGEGTVALVTVERSTFFRREVIEMSAGGDYFALPITASEAPNVYVSATILGQNESGQYEMRQGYILIEVAPSAQTLTVEITSEPEILMPGESMTMGIRVLDGDGAPVEGEFSVAIVDKAVLALAEPNAEDILTAFYDIQPLGINTNASQVAATDKFVPDAGGLGGGGDIGEPVLLRDDFEDTAFWQADVVTDQNGLAELVIPMPDNLTTWNILVRGVTTDTLVGEAEVEVISTLPLLIRPVTPRFLIEKDHVEIAGVVHNNTGEELSLTVSLSGDGFLLDEAGAAQQTFSLADGQRARVSWWGTVEDVEAIDFTFSVSGGEWSDNVVPEYGSIPVYKYVSPKTYGTAGMLAGEEEILELVSMPGSMTVIDGELIVSVQTSLTAVLQDSLDGLFKIPRYENIEQRVSRVLSALTLTDLLLSADKPLQVSQAEIAGQVEALLSYLEEKQQKSGGWGWTATGKTNPYVTAYISFALQQIQESGYSVDPAMLIKSYDYLQSILPSISMLSETWQYERLAFIVYVLARGERHEISLANGLFINRDKISPWGRSFLALALWTIDETDPDMAVLVSDLASESVVSASGVHWDYASDTWWNMNSPVFNDSVVVYTLSQISPDSSLLDDAVRYLMLARGSGGCWSTTYDTSWVIQAAAAYIGVSADLQASFDFVAALNGEELISGTAQVLGAEIITENIPIFDLNADLPNALEFSRDEGDGRLYYSSWLQLQTPVEEIEPISQGVFIERAYYVYGEDCAETECSPITGGLAGDLLLVRISLSVPDDLHYVMVEDFLPAGAEAVDPSLLTSQLGLDTGAYDDVKPYAWGWNWWVFDEANYYDNRVTWSAEYLQAGTYELTYILQLTQPGEFQVLPAHVWQMYFPDVQATTGGEIFTVEQE